MGIKNEKLGGASNRQDEYGTNAGLVRDYGWPMKANQGNLKNERLSAWLG